MVEGPKDSFSIYTTGRGVQKGDTVEGGERGHDKILER